jgi:NAD(P)-dependent dehydrogenase (short-subunit alcohol dehydrogenase family)
MAFAERGARVALLARGPDGLAAARDDVERAGGDALVLPTDVADAEQVEAAAAAVEAAWGGIDVWVNNAMVSVFAPCDEVTPEEYRRVTDVTYLGVVYGTLAALRRMRRVDRGTILQVGSALAYRSIPLQAAYCAAKHAVKGFTESLLCELRHDKSRIRLAMVHLPAINTPQFDWVRSRLPRRARPVPPVFQPELAARAILWTLDHPRRELLLAWPTAKAVLGEKVAPGLVDRYLSSFGYDSQQVEEPEDPARPDNLWHALPGDRGAHGRFDAEAHRTSTHFWLTRRRTALLAAGLGLAGALLGRRLRASASLPFASRSADHA